MILNQLKKDFDKFSTEDLCQEIVQGYEQISLGQPQFSGKFAQCNVLLLINEENGATFFKHAGPRSIELLTGDEVGVNFQSNYQLFIDHVAKNGQKLIILPVYGALSHQRGCLVKEATKLAQELNISVNMVKPIDVPSGDFIWNMVYDPKAARIITEHYINADSDAVYNEHKVPSLNPELFIDSTEELRLTIKKQEKIQSLKGRMRSEAGLGLYEDLENILSNALNDFNEEELYEIIEQPLSDYCYENILDILKLELSRQISNSSNISASNTLRCIELISKYGAKDDISVQKYMLTLLDAIEESNSSEINDFAITIAGNMIELVGEGKRKDFLFRKLNCAKQDLNELSEFEIAKRSKAISDTRIYLWNQIASGLALGHTISHFQKGLRDSNLTLDDIGATGNDVTHAFNKGTLLEMARSVLSDYGFGKITKPELVMAFANFDQNDIGVNISDDIDINDSQIMDMYDGWHAKAISRTP